MEKKFHSETPDAPRLVCFTDCPGGKISGLKNDKSGLMVSSCTLHKRIHYRWNRYPCIGIYTSSDGIDIDSSNDILITSTRIEAHDDCISINPDETRTDAE